MILYIGDPSDKMVSPSIFTMAKRPGLFIRSCQWEYFCGNTIGQTFISYNCKRMGKECLWNSWGIHSHPHIITYIECCENLKHGSNVLIFGHCYSYFTQNQYDCLLPLEQTCKMWENKSYSSAMNQYTNTTKQGITRLCEDILSFTVGNIALYMIIYPAVNVALYSLSIHQPLWPILFIVRIIVTSFSCCLGQLASTIKCQPFMAMKQISKSQHVCIIHINDIPLHHVVH